MFMTRKLQLFIKALFLILCIFINSFAIAQQNTDDNFEYILGAGDKLRVTIFGEEDLTGQFEIDPSGQLSMSLIGAVKAQGLNTRELEELISNKYANGYLINPRVSIEVLNFRPFFILGEVNKPGSYPYVNGLTVLNAVALAGGYTHRAKTDKVMVKRGKDNKGKEFEISEGDIVHPGDIIRVRERFF
jgi:polysaccharide export outer membrane protein